ncbi:Uma2 family endonuclease [Cohnella zeiphila]|uniref:Uma2 family endonuclease n=1 Tax=Cohnella zeiphila TaxID=2761120 RepID=A0A7X0SVD4_9BACL|nr:Uma2 family endonuclease [Cohnella zeiphila]MBB6734568.1 Uma2 family endonuclease [Cohnella zeiphila]
MKYEKSSGVPEHLIREEPYSYEDYANLPDDGNRYEVADGVLQAMSPSPGTKHQKILRNLTASFQSHCKPSGQFFFAPLDVILSRYHVRQPDFIFVSNERLTIVTERGIEGAPDLAAEILSPSTAQKDKTEKRLEYARFGVKEYWIIDPVYELLEQHVLDVEERRFSLRHIYKRGDVVESGIVPCVQLSLQDLFD